MLMKATNEEAMIKKIVYNKILPNFIKIEIIKNKIEKKLYKT